MIFTARMNIPEKCQEQIVDLYMAIVDIIKAVDTVCRDGLWEIMASFGCPPTFRALVRQFHDDMLATVSEPFPVTNGVSQDCVLASTLFGMMFSVMLTGEFQDCDDGFPSKYPFDGIIWLQTKPKYIE